MRENAVIFDPERKLFLYFGVLILAIGVGPFGTYARMGFWDRTVFWSLDVLGGMAIIVPVAHVFYGSALVRFLPPLLRLLAGTALGAIPAAGYITVLYGSVGQKLQIDAPYPLLFLEVTVFSFVLFLVEFVAWPKVFGGHATVAKSAEDETPVIGPAQVSRSAGEIHPGDALLKRLPAELRGAEIISISMQDHYAQVVTSRGEALLLIRLSDAMDLVTDVDGGQIHRSHWVAAAHVGDLVKDGRKHELVLATGVRLPVGGKFLENARGMLPG